IVDVRYWHKADIALCTASPMSEPRAEKRLLIRLAPDVHDAIVRAARGRHTTKTEFIERLLTVIVEDDLIDALLDERDQL
ncbi:MAG: hypothetical protein WA753_20335, partial [Pseudolabrys sp.]